MYLYIARIIEQVDSVKYVFIYLRIYFLLKDIKSAERNIENSHRLICF
jgi:hypothetical protein